MNSKAEKYIQAFDAVIWTEGKTDWMHLKKAMEMLEIKLNIRFEEYEKSMGSKKLLAQCKNSAQITPSECLIYIFDRDEKDIIKDVAEPDESEKGFKSWGNGVFSLAIPVPAHRHQHENLCIEFYYSDKEIATVDSEGRRIYLSSEFKEKSGKYKDNPLISLGNKWEVKNSTSIEKSKIVDGGVFDGDDKNIALSKADFAEHIVKGDEPFDQFSFESFREVFNIIETIINTSSSFRGLFFNSELNFLPQASSASLELRSARLIGEIYKLCKIAIFIFIASVIRYYESEIINEEPKFRKKIGRLKEIISDDFANPSLRSIRELLRQCYYLADENAPKEVIDIKSCFEKNFTLGVLGNLLDYLEELYPTQRPKARIINKSEISKSLLNYVFPELFKYGEKVFNVELLSQDISKLENPNDRLIEQSLEKLKSIFSVVIANSFSSADTSNLRTENKRISSTLLTYHQSKIEKEKISWAEDADFPHQYSKCSIIISKSKNMSSLNLFPFLTVKDEKIFFYKRRLAKGYEFHTLFSDEKRIELTKKKFSHSFFGLGIDAQHFFWNEIIPVESDANGMLANIPTETVQGSFVGREKSIEEIIKNVIEVPNENAIVFGPGGVGKTALMIELSNKLFNDSNIDNVLYKNLIWISAKRDYYNPALDIIEQRPRAFSTLDDVFSAIFDFFGYSDLDNYKREDRQYLIVDIFRENKTLLILDNFETVPKAERQSIVEFFGGQLKTELKRKPEYFKVLITSRELIPSGFRQIELEPLGQRDSRSLMNSLFDTYKDSGKEKLSTELQDKLYKATFGIPLIIKHCYAQIYDYSSPVNTVITKLKGEPTKVIDFSFSEIFQLLKKDKLQLRIIILLELVNVPLLIRQMADVLEYSELDLENKLVRLVSFQCVRRFAFKMEEKYSVNDEMRLLSKRTVQDNPEVSQEIKKNIEKNFSLERRMDYTQEEYEVIRIFERYVSEGDFCAAEDFIRDELKRHAKSILLNYKYAEYLHEKRSKTLEAIKILENIRQDAVNDPLVLQLLVSYYSSLDIPNFQEASIYARALKTSEDGRILLCLAEFYVKWSTSLKVKSELDPIKEIERQQKYKSLADEAVRLLRKIPRKSHYHFYLMAQSYYNKWLYDKALEWIEKAIEALPSDSYRRSPYVRFRQDILSKRDRYGARA